MGYPNLAEKIKSYRKKAGITQADAAVALGLKRSTYAYYETGKTTPKLSTLNDMAKMYQVPVSEFISAGDLDNGKESKVTAITSIADFDDRFYDLTDTEKTVIMKLRIMNRDKRTEIIDSIIG